MYSVPLASNATAGSKRLPVVPSPSSALSICWVDQVVPPSVLRYRSMTMGAVSQWLNPTRFSGLVGLMTRDISDWSVAVSAAGGALRKALTLIVAPGTAVCVPFSTRETARRVRPSSGAHRCRTGAQRNRRDRRVRKLDMGMWLSGRPVEPP